MDVLASRRFTLEDQTRFAALSGDWNPIHVDPLAARRLLAGEVVVHGVHTVLWALDAWLSSGGALNGVAATFLRPVLLDRDTELTRSEDGLEVRQGGEALATIRLQRGAAPAPLDGQGDAPARSTPKAHSFADLKDAAGEVAIGGDAGALFPMACAALGSGRVAAVMALSRVVGMEAPGADSLFAGLDISFDDAAAATLSWRVARHSVPQAPLTIAVSGGGLKGTLSAFVRPAPTAQLSMAEVAGHVIPGEFAGQDALIVGGSRGLGELMAKIIAAGGGRPVITFAQGEDEARAVAGEIEAAGGTCRTQRFEASADAANCAALMASPPSHLYYFASPRIAPSAKGRFDAAKAARFFEVYASAFAALCMAARAPVRAFYPSSTYVDEQPAGFMEYVAGKAAGEAVCAMLDRHAPHVHVLPIRLPRLRTDQTAAITGKTAQEPLELMIDVARQLNGLAKEPPR